MTLRKISVEEVSNIKVLKHGNVICNSPSHTPAYKGNHTQSVIYDCNYDFTVDPPEITFQYDVELEYLYSIHGTTFSDYCEAFGNTGTVALPSGSTLCDGTSTIIASITAPVSSITTTPNSVSASFTANFTVTNLCTQTLICINDVNCPNE